MSETENVRRGGISVETQHIFPIIKKWLYSDKDIFLREIVSNASDAIIKLKRLASLGQTELPEGEDFKVTVSVDKDARTITVTDNGIGMTEDEVQRYICSIALSGALEFIEKYESGDTSNGIIGHFGLGFYSSFMVSETVELETKSYTDAPAVRWVCTESGEYEVSPSDRTERGTSVIMHISEAEAEYLEAFKLREILNKYCAFMPVPVFFVDENEVHDHDKSDDECECCEHDHNTPINDTVPLWTRNPSEIAKEEYVEFYHKLFLDADDPLFYIHINADYPLNFKGILYFPKIRYEAQSLEGQVKLFYNQVFVADNIKEVLPDYLLMLRGALDCPELPLNVSRSYLQDNAYVRKIAQHIVKKVADKLNSMALNDREEYEKVYGDIRIFIEYACLRERKFYDRVKDSLLLRLTDGKCRTFNEYLTDAEEKHKNTVYYTSDPDLQSQYVSMLAAENIEVAIFDLLIDSQYMTAMEQYRDELKFIRVDSGVADVLKDSDAVTEEVPAFLSDLFKKVSGSEKLGIKAESLKSNTVPAVLSVSEDSRRMQEMMKMFMPADSDMSAYPLDYTLSLNTSSELYRKLCELADPNGKDTEKAEVFASFIYRLALIAQRKPDADELNAFLSDSYKILGLI